MRESKGGRFKRIRLGWRWRLIGPQCIYWGSMRGGRRDWGWGKKIVDPLIRRSGWAKRGTDGAGNESLADKDPTTPGSNHGRGTIGRRPPRGLGSPGLVGGHAGEGGWVVGCEWEYLG